MNVNRRDREDDYEQAKYRLQMHVLNSARLLRNVYCLVVDVYVVCKFSGCLTKLAI